MQQWEYWLSGITPPLRLALKHYSTPESRFSTALCHAVSFAPVSFAPVSNTAVLTQGHFSLILRCKGKIRPKIYQSWPWYQHVWWTTATYCSPIAKGFSASLLLANKGAPDDKAAETSELSTRHSYLSVSLVIFSLWAGVSALTLF